MHAQTDRPIPRIAVVQATDAVHADALNAVSREILQANTFTHLSQTHSSEKPTEDSGTSNDCLFGVCVCVCVCVGELGQVSVPTTALKRLISRSTHEEYQTSFFVPS